VLGHDIASAGADIRAVVGYMPEHECLPPDVRAIDFVVHMGRMSGLPAAAARERAADVLRHVGLAEERYRLMGGYSTGMKQRAKLAQALVHDPKLVLLDEPTNGLDPEARDDMIRLVARIGRSFGIPVLVTSHLLGELERVSDHVIVLDDGRLLSSQATTELTQDTGLLLVEVLGTADDQHRMGEALAAGGLPCRPRQQMIEVDARAVAGGVAPHDVIRDTACDLGLGLVRIQAEHGRIQDVFDSAGRGHD
jgi:ABC-2 type transport system ATP-binding protein